MPTEQVQWVLTLALREVPDCLHEAIQTVRERPLQRPCEERQLGAGHQHMPFFLLRDEVA